MQKNYVLIAVTLLLGIVFSLLIYFTLLKWERIDKEVTFNTRAQNIVHDLENDLHDFSSIMYSVGDFVQLSTSISQNNFQKFSDAHIARNPSVKFFSWNPYLVAEDRMKYEAALNQLDATKQIFSVDDNGRLIGEQDRGYYFPAHFIAPIEKYSFLQSLNFAFNAEIHDVIKKSLNTQDLAATLEIQFKVENNIFNGFFLAWPVYDASGNNQTKKGVVFATIDSQLLFENSVMQAASYDYRFIVYKAETNSQSKIIFSSNSDDLLSQFETREMKWQGQLSFADHQLNFIVVPNSQVLDDRILTVSWFAFLVMLIMTVGFCFYWLTRHHYTLEAVLNARQQTLANEKLAKEIIDRLRVEEQLTKFAHAFQLSADGINMLDMQGNYTYSNAAALELLDYEAEQMYQLHYHDINQDSQIQDLNILELVTREGTWQGELNQTRREGTHFLASVSLSLIKDDTNNNIGFLEVTRDITETNLLEAELQQSRKMEALGTLAGGIAHDFNNILASILGNTEMMVLTDIEPTKAQSYIDNIQESCNRAADLVKQIMTFSRMESQQFTSIDLGKTVNEALTIIRVSIPANIRLVTSIAPDCPNILGDATQIHQIIMNLCANAAHGIGEEGGTIAIDLQPETELMFDQQHVVTSKIRLSITDTGKGIEQDVLERIFDPFFTTKKMGEGTGLGLSVVKSVVEDHGGEIFVKSQDFLGATFTIILPVEQEYQKVEKQVTNAIMTEDTASLESEEALEEKAQTHIKTPTTKHVLIAEDEKHIAKLYDEFLTDYGYRTTVCSDGAEALKVYMDSNSKIDLVLTDQSMPNMTGKELSLLLLQKQPELPIIMCTGYSEVISEESAKEIGIRHYFLKPASLSKLMNVIDKLLKE